jgi:hypothetical protein
MMHLWCNSVIDGSARCRDASMTCDERSVEEQNGNEDRVRRKEEGDLAVGKSQDPGGSRREIMQAAVARIQNTCRVAPSLEPCGLLQIVSGEKTFDRYWNDAT